jgi:cyclic GMP-AMP synthase DncV-like protein
MADVQALFEAFHKRIRTYYEINDVLRAKKDIIVERVNKNLAQKKRPSCVEFIQGSYKMKVGILAVKGAEYDIDVGLRFSFKESEHSPEEVRGWVFDAVDGHTEKVERRSSCIRVIYADGYHVDLVPYAWWDEGGVEQYRLAHKTKNWRPADPPALVEFVKQVRKPFEGVKDKATDTDQFRRIVRYLKRWNDVALPMESHDKPSGLALLLLTKHYLPAPMGLGSGDDRTAVEQVARAAAATSSRIVEHKPTPEKEDVFARISESSMNALKQRFGVLRDALVFARDTNDVNKACKELKKVFGDDFPCPESEEKRTETARRTAAPAIVPSSSSA